MNGIDFSDRLRTLRCERQIKAASTVSRAMGIPDSTYAMYEAGVTFPNVKNLIKLAQYFDVSTDWLLGLSSSRKGGNDG